VLGVRDCVVDGGEGEGTLRAAFFEMLAERAGIYGGLAGTQAREGLQHRRLTFLLPFVWGKGRV